MVNKTDFLKKLMARPMFRPVLYTAILHISFLIFISFGWDSQPLPKPVASAGHVQVSMIKASELEKRFPALQKLKKEKLLKRREIAIQKRRRLKEKRRIAKRRLKRQQELKRRQAIRKKKELERKKAILLKKAEIKKQKKKQEELRKQKRKQKELEREILTKKRMAEKKQALKKQEQFLKKQALKAVMEKALKEQAAQVKEQKKQLQLAKLKAEALAAAQKAKQNSAEVAILTARIKAMITNRWHIPISAKPGMRVLLKIKLLPTGELNAAVISKSSGDSAYDNSALSAVKSIRNYPVPSDNDLFEQNFRQFYMSFSPQDQITQ